MVRKQLSISELQNQDGTYSICLNNAGRNIGTLNKVKKIIKHFASGNEFFFGHYRTDGFNISNEEFIQYGLEIPNYFKSYGTYQRIIVVPEKKTRFFHKPSCELIVCRGHNDTSTYDMLDKIFHYYLETILFCPKIDWETFVDSYRGYMNSGARDYAINGFTDFLFSYVDSGDFSISFDSKVYNPQIIRAKIDQILEDTGDGSKTQGTVLCVDKPRI